jgi:hypothetical protein
MVNSDRKTTHVVVSKTLHQKLKILSAQMQVPMVDLAREALELLLFKYYKENKNTEEN